MDDIGLDHKCLGQQLKIWADRFGCVLEIKGGAVADNYETFVVTSQYQIEEIWEDEHTREALKRRFRIIHMSDPFNLIGRPSGEGSEGDGRADSDGV